MANRRPVSALEIKQEVEGYSSMNEDAFARRFYADRAELESLGISLQVQKPAEGFFEAELYALPPENYYLPQIEFTDEELAALRTALGLLDGQFYLIGYSHEREAVRVFRLSRIRGKVSYASKAEHDFSPPADFDRRDYASRAGWQMGEIEGTAAVFVRERIAWLVERDFGGYGEMRKPVAADGVGKARGSVYETEYASRRQLVSWVLGWRDNA